MPYHFKHIFTLLGKLDFGSLGRSQTCGHGGGGWGSCPEIVLFIHKNLANTILTAIILQYA